MLEDRNGGARRCSGTNVRIPRDDQTVQGRQRRVLCSSGRTNGQRAEEEPNESMPHKNSASSIGKRTAPKLCRDSVLLCRRCKTRRKVPSGGQATPTLTCTNAVGTESRLEPKSEDRFSSQKLERNAPQEDGIATIVQTTTGSAETPERASTTAQLPVLVFN